MRENHAPVLSRCPDTAEFGTIAKENKSGWDMAKEFGRRLVLIVKDVLGKIAPANINCPVGTSSTRAGATVADCVGQEDHRL